MPFLKVTQGGLKNGDAFVLNDLAFIIPKGQITVILGPSGTGKSTLLKMIADKLPTGFSTTGSWERSSAFDDSQTPVILLPQIRQRKPPELQGHPRKPTGTWHWTHTLKQKHATLLLDEPVKGTEKDETQELIQALKEKGPDQTVVMITHNLALATAVADYIVLVCAGKLEAAGPAQAFFANPPTPLAEKFLTTGNCWPQSPSLSLPTHFRWIVPDLIAGMGKPGLLRDLDVDLESIGMAGITNLVSLTTQPVPPEKLQSFAIQGRHFYIKDMGVPSLNAAASVISSMEKKLKVGQSVAYHCRAGLGRTGTMLACHLTWRGVPPQTAVEDIRKLQPAYIQNKTQLDFVFQFAKTFCKTSSTTLV